VIPLFAALQGKANAKVTVLLQGKANAKVTVLLQGER
jgi:uncharacterized protein YggU (UPF0235/DUF167 family)